MLTIISRALINTECIKLYSMMLSVSILTLAVVTAVEASYIPTGQVDNNAYEFFPTPTAWDPGANTARIGGFPAGGGATWSIMGAGLFDVSGFDPHGASTVDISSLGNNYYSLIDIENIIDSAMDTWAAVSGFTNLGQVADGNVGIGAAETSGGHIGDIRFGAIYIDGDALDPVNSGPILAHGYQPGTESIFGPGGTIAGDIHIDNSEEWGSTFDLETVIIHELGHALGLGHSDVSGAIMNPYYTGVSLTLGADDIAGIQAIYGAAVVPIPATAWLFLSGIGVLGIISRKQIRV